MKVKIGIVPALTKEGEAKVEQSYIDYVTEGGAEVIILPYPKEKITDGLLAECNGFLFLGGADISPSRYGEVAKEQLGETIPGRDEYEFEAFRLIFNTGKPIFAVCRGMQLVNCALGGTLYQDLPSEHPTDVAHRADGKKYDNYHEAAFLEGTYLHGVLGGELFTVNSYHHQAIKTLGNGLAVMARATDGVIEAIYHTGERILWGFQWHPERIDNRTSRRISAAFISACGDAGKRREVRVRVDRPIGSTHPKDKSIVYGVNYGYVEGVIGGDGEAQDAYVLGVDEPISEFVGELIAVVHRGDDNECKWIVAPEGTALTPDEIRAAVDFQEKYFDSYIEVIK